MIFGHNTVQIYHISRQQFMKLVVFGWFCSKIFSMVDMNSITDAAIINRFLKLLFCNRSWFLDITQSKYIITRQQCLKSPEMLILCEAGQNDLQKCPSLTKFLPHCILKVLSFRKYFHAGKMIKIWGFRLQARYRDILGLLFCWVAIKSTFLRHDYFCWQPGRDGSRNRGLGQHALAIHFLHSSPSPATSLHRS